MEPKFKVGDEVQYFLAAREYGSKNVSTYIVEKVYDNRTPEYPNMEAHYDIQDNGVARTKYSAIRVKQKLLIKYGFS